MKKQTRTIGAATVFVAAISVAFNSNCADQLPSVPGTTTTIYATNVFTPFQMAMAEDGTMYVGNDTNAAFARIWRIGKRGTPVELFGDTLMGDPDGVAVDIAGNLTGTAGAVLVAGSVGIEGIVYSVMPNGSVSNLTALQPAFVNPGPLFVDPTGRLLFADTRFGCSGSSYDRLGSWGMVSPPSMIAISAPMPRPYSIASDSQNRILVSSACDNDVRLFSLDGALLNASFFKARVGSPLATAKGGFWGTNVYSLDPAGQLICADDQGRVTVKGTQFTNSTFSLLFDNSGNLYVTEYYQSRILKITPNPADELHMTVHVSCLDICWNSKTNKSYQVQYRSDLTTNQWVNLGAPVSGTGTNTCVTDAVTSEKRFYRVEELP